MTPYILFLSVIFLKLGLVEAQVLTAAEQTALLTQVNNLRATEGAVNMQCLTYSTALATQALAWAQQCRGAASLHTTAVNVSCYGDVGELIYAQANPVTSTDFGNIAQSWSFLSLIMGNYDYATDTCLSNVNYCNIYRQFQYAQGFEIGCAKATCTALTGALFNAPLTAGSVLNCAVGPRITANGQPFRQCLSSNATQCSNVASGSDCCYPSIRGTRTSQGGVASLCCSTGTATNCTNPTTLTAATLGASLPVTDTATQASWIAQLNTVRGVQNASDMQCITTWNNDLRSTAQTWAEQCNFARPTDSQYGACYTDPLGVAIQVQPLADTSLSMFGTPGPGDVALSYGVEGLLYYNPNTTICSNTTYSCLNYLNAMFNDVSDVGCGQAYCKHITGVPNQNNDYPGWVSVCATGKRYPGLFAPFNTTGAACADCPGYKNTCTNGLCCGTAGECDGDGTLRQYWAGGLLTNHFYTTRPYDAYVATTLNPIWGYNFERNLCTIFTDATRTTCATARPLTRLYNFLQGNHFYAATDSDRNAARDRYLFTEELVEGYVVMNNGECGATVPVYRFFNGNVGDHFYTTSPAVPPVVNDTTQAANYASEGVKFYCF